MKKSSSLYTNMGWRVMLDFLSRGTFFLINILIARVLGVNEFGKLAYAISLVQMFYIFTEMGIHMQLMKEIGEARGSDEHLWQVFFYLKLMLIGACFIACAGISYVLWRWENRWLPVLALMWMFSNSMLDFNQLVCNGLGRLDLARTQLILQRSMVLIGVGISLLFFRTLCGILLGLAVSGTIGATLSNIYFFRARDAKFNGAADARKWAEILWRALPNGIGVAFGSWYLRMGSLILGWVWTSEVLGEYSAAFRIFEMTYVIPAAIMNIGVPHLAEALRQNAKVFRSEFFRVLTVILPLAALWVGILRFGSSNIIAGVFGGKYARSAPVLRILAWVGGMVFLNYLITHMMLIINHQRRHAVHEILVFLLSIIFSVWLIPTGGATGAAWTLLLTEICLFIMTLTFLVRHWPQHREEPGVALVEAQ